MQREYELNEIDEVATQLIEAFPQHRCFAFFATMGTGKTTLIYKLCAHLQCVEQASSPTFSIINEYVRENEESVFHMDWYRLKGEEDAIEAGVQDIMERKDCFQFVEWPEIAISLLPKQYVHVTLEVVSLTRRRIMASESKA